jgi:four helix bundle protein
LKILRFEDIECWQQARELVRLVYCAVNASESFKRDFRMNGQITGAALSVMNNIAEGWASQSNAEFIRFLTYSRRSCAETQTCAYAALDQSYILQEVFTELYNQAHKTLQIIDGFLRYLRSQRTKRS